MSTTPSTSPDDIRRTYDDLRRIYHWSGVPFSGSAVDQLTRADSRLAVAQQILRAAGSEDGCHFDHPDDRQTCFQQLAEDLAVARAEIARANRTVGAQANLLYLLAPSGRDLPASARAEIVADATAEGVPLPEVDGVARVADPALERLQARRPEGRR